MGGKFRTDPLTDQQRELLGSTEAVIAIAECADVGIKMAKASYCRRYDMEEAYDYALDSVLLKVRHFDENRGAPLECFLRYFTARKVKMKLVAKHTQNRKTGFELNDINWKLFATRKDNTLERTELVDGLLNCLTSKQRKILCWTYGLNGECVLSFKQIARRCRVDRRNVQAVVSRALRRLRQEFIDKGYEGIA